MAKATVEERFWAKVNKTETCWLWTGAANGNGYGHLWHRTGKQLAHRLAYQWLVGPIPEGLTLDHLCRVRRCVRPSHLEPVTHAENMRRGAWGRRTHCPRGHPYDQANTYRVPGLGHRQCRICTQASRRERTIRERIARVRARGGS